MSASAERSSLSMARSPNERMPTALFPCTTGIRRTEWRRMSSTARSTGSSGDNVCRSLLQMSDTWVCSPSRPDTIARTTMSRSVKRPRTFESATTTAPTSRSFINRAASTTVDAGCTVTGSGVITSCTRCGMTAPHCRFVYTSTQRRGQRCDRKRSACWPRPSGLELGEVLLAPFRRPLRVGFLTCAQLHAADLARDGLRELEELDPPHPLVRREPSPREAEKLEGRVARGFRSGCQRDVGLRDAEPELVGRGYDRRLGDEGVLDQHALDLERADLVVRRLEDVVGPADERDVAVVVSPRHVAAVVVAVGHRPGVSAPVAGHQAPRAVRQVETDLSFPRAFDEGAARDVDERDRDARERPAHGAGLERRAGWVPHRRRGLGLPVAVADREPPLLAHL